MDKLAHPMGNGPIWLYSWPPYEKELACLVSNLRPITRWLGTCFYEARVRHREMEVSMKKFVLAVTLILLAAVSGFAQKSKLSPELAHRHDKSMVEVIIQYKVAPSARHQRRIASRNGTVQTDFSFIKSLHASVPASRLAELAKDKDVEYISLNRQLGSKLYNTAGAVNAQASWNLNLD